MKFRKMFILVMAMTLLFGTAAYAETVTQNIKVFLNKKELDDSGMLVDNRAYVAIGTLAKSLQAFVSWDNSAKEVSINKPNVHMFTMIDNNAFQSIPRDRYKFRVHAQVDSLKTEITSLKFTITDPYEEETLIEARYPGDENFPSGKVNFLLNTSDFSYNFKYIGNYTVKLWMDPVGDATAQVVAEKLIIVK